jgi:hypothetical protein
MWRQLLHVKALLLLFTVFGFMGGCHAANYPGPTVSNEFSSRGVNEVSYGFTLGPANSFPLRSASLGFFLFAAVCAIGAAWIHVTELRTRPNPNASNDVDSFSDFEVIN